MTNHRPIYILDEETRPIDNDYSNAFATKEGNTQKRNYVSTAITTSQSRFMEHQIFPFNTWLMDLVRFDNGVWFCWFIEANTRYLIAIEGNGRTITADAWETFSARVPTDFFLDAFKAFQQLNTIPSTTRARAANERRKPVSLIIGDSEKAFWSERMLQHYHTEGIEYERINTKQEGHIRLAILDRSVRTIRDMLYRLNIQRVSPDNVYRAVAIYNNTVHKTLGYTPKQVHCSEALERRVIQNLKADNWVRTHRTDYPIPAGSEVSVRKQYSIFEKRRSTVRSGKHTLMSRNKRGQYSVRNNEGETFSVYRRDLKPILKRK